ncbi:MAG: hypothetical protein E7Z89_04220 [Cyanobacteria bacterium SIG28]|nr:hypothetical protein [Cyanobacteria bacterium SIG28]
MVKAINASLGKVKPFMKKTAMATMFATSVIAGNANAKNVQKSEPIVNQTEVVSKSGAEAIVAAAQVNNTSKELYSTKHNEKIDKLYIKTHGGTKGADIAELVTGLDQVYEQRGSFYTAMMAGTVIAQTNFDKCTEEYLAHPDAKEKDLASKLNSLYFDKFVPSFYKGLQANMEKESKAHPKGLISAEDCNRLFDEAVANTEWLNDDMKKTYKVAMYETRMTMKPVKGATDDPVKKETALLLTKAVLLNSFAFSGIADNLGFLDEEKNFTDPLFTEIMLKHSINNNK